MENNKPSQELLAQLGKYFQAHPWHGVSAGDKSPEILRSYIETVPGDHMKYEICKKTGFLFIDRPNKYSNIIPALYGFVPQTYCAEEVAARCMEVEGLTNIVGDGDPLDICVLADRPIVHGGILLDAKVIGGFRMIDGGEADDKIIAVLKGDQTYGEYNDINDVPKALLKRLKHYFLTYKEDPDGDRNANKEVEIVSTYGKAEAYEVIKASQADYKKHHG